MKKICINGGHFTGKDPGAVGKSGLCESDVTYRIMELVSYYLQQVDYDTLMVYENELSDIVYASNEYGADLFISIHCNAAENTSAKGTETFCISMDSPGGKLASLVQDQIVSNLGTVNRGVKNENFYVLRHTDCPAILIETAFISNEEDEAMLLNENKLDEFASAIARGISDYFA